MHEWKDCHMTKPLILVTGATGTVGTELVGQLVAAGQRVRALVRDPAKAARFADGVEIAIADLSMPETLDAAFAGVDKAFVLSNGPAIALQGNAFAAAKRAEVGHIVRLSAQELEFRQIADAPLGQWHLESERRLRDSGVPWTILRPSYFASNTLIPLFFDPRQGSALPAGAGKEAPIDPRDIAAVAVKALTTPGHESQTYVITGPELLGQAEMMAKASVALGKPLTYVDVSPDEARERMLAFGFPPPFADSVLGHFAAVRAGRVYLTSTVANLLGRPPRSFDDWLRDNAAALNG
jgi:uncharacterized protein YbjT (DUF2867 family)